MPMASSTPATWVTTTPTASVHWTGRRTEMIKTGGANVSPAELEVQLRACAPVKLARVVGVPDARLDQIVVLAVTLKEGADAGRRRDPGVPRASASRRTRSPGGSSSSTRARSR